MKTIAAAAALGLALLGGGSAYASTASDPAPAAPAATALSAGLSEEAAKNLAYSRDEERMARDLYRLIADHYDGARPFANITQSEQRHFDAVGRMLTRYGIDDPAQDKPAGTYASAEIQRLYDGWKDLALTSRAEAHKVGVELETRDIADLKRLAADPSLPDDLSTVYGNLLAGSENHLKAFTAAVDGKTGMGSGQGQGMRNGQGQGMRTGQGPGQGSGQCQTTGACQAPGQGMRNGQGQGMQQGQSKGLKRDGSGGGYGRTGERPANCPLAS